ncbi:unnamed protein product, partial [Polarella glacialis]
EKLEEPLLIRVNPGPVLQRRCTDTLCGLLFALALTGLAALVSYTTYAGDLRQLKHGQDHEGNLCGLGTMADRPLTFYPDLQHDFAKDNSLHDQYGLCVSQGCPKQGSVVQDYGGETARRPEWLAAQPSFAVFGRCVPYEQPARSSGTLLCAYPACQSTESFPTNPMQVCGLARDGTDKYWLLEQPDWSIQDGWATEGADEFVVKLRTAMATNAASTPEAAGCQERLRRETQISLGPADAGASYAFLTQITSPIFTFSRAVASNLGLVLGLGVGGALVCAMLVMLCLPSCAQVVLLSLLALLFVVLMATDYVLFVQAGVTSGIAGDRFKSFLEANLNMPVPPGADSLLKHTSRDAAMDQIYLFAAILLALAIASLVFVALSMGKQFKLVVALVREAGKTVRSIPSLMALPLLLLCSMALFTTLLSAGLLGVGTASPEKVQEALAALSLPSSADPALDFHRWQTASGLLLIIGFLWVYFFHVALFTTTVALTVARWYFRDAENEHQVGAGLGNCLGWPVLASLRQVFRYHLGSLALGSLLMTVFTIPRMVLEYIDHHTKSATGQNALARGLLCVPRCMLGCQNKNDNNNNNKNNNTKTTTTITLLRDIPTKEFEG